MKLYMEENKNLEGQVQQNQEPDNKPEEKEPTVEELMAQLAQERAKTDDVTSKPVTVTVNGASVTVNSDGSFSKEITLVNGSNTITVVATDKAGKTTTVTRKVTLDTGAPVFEKVTLTPNPVDCGKTFVISVKVTD